MSVHELNRDQMIELKQSMLTERMLANDAEPSWGELADADETISDDEVINEYAGTNFVNDDFFCTANL